MNWIGTFRHYSPSLARATVVLFAAGWLGLAVQPCVAASAHDAGTPAPGMPGGHGHDCPHCPPPADDRAGCGDAVTLDCAAAGEPALVSQAVKVPDTHMPAGMPPAPLHQVLAEPGRASPRAPPDPARRIVPRSLQQRYCSYLN